MSMMDNLGGKAREAMGNEEISDKGLDVASQQAKQRMEGHDEHIDKAREMLDGKLGHE